MAITFVNETSGTVSTGSGEETKSLPASLAEDDIVMVMCVSDSALGSAGVKNGQGYTIINGIDTSSPGRQVVYKRMGSTPDSDVVLLQLTDKPTAYIIQAWRGVDTSDAEDQTFEGINGNGYSPDPPSITTQTDGALVIAIGFLDDDDTTVSTWPSGYTNQAEQNGGTATLAVSSKIIATAGAEDPSAYTFASNDLWWANTIALKPAESEPPTGTNTQINIGDSWKEISAAQINIGDTWKAVEGMQINIGDTWKEVF